jgi:accessory Sec system S-layer assembly protein
MLSFFKRKDKKIEKQGAESVVDSQELFGENDVEESRDQLVMTSLYFTPDMQVSQEDRYYFQFLHNELPPLKPNQISIAGIEIKPHGNDWHVGAFVRSTVTKRIQFIDMPLLLIGPNGEKLGRKVFNMNKLTDLPPNSSIPWLFIFDASSLNTDILPEEGWTLGFDIKAKHHLDLADSWEKNLSQADKDGLAEFVKNLQPPKEGEVNFLGIQSRISENGQLHITVLIRNGNSFDINLEQVPLFVEDASSEVVAKGIFKLEDFIVKTNTSKPWTFVFPKDMVTKDPIDLSQWKVYPPQKNA